MSFTVPRRPLAPVIHLDDYRTADRQGPAIEPGPVWDEIDAAARLFGRLRHAGMSVRFVTEGRSGPPRVAVTDLEGRVLREVAPEVACDPAALEQELLGPAA